MLWIYTVNIHIATLLHILNYYRFLLCCMGITTAKPANYSRVSFHSTSLQEHGINRSFRQENKKWSRYWHVPKWLYVVTLYRGNSYYLIFYLQLESTNAIKNKSRTAEKSTLSAIRYNDNPLAKFFWATPMNWCQYLNARLSYP